MHAGISAMLEEMTKVREVADVLPDVGEDSETITSIVRKIRNVTSELKTNALHACFRTVRSTWNELEVDIDFLRGVEGRLASADDGDDGEMVPFTPKAEDTDVNAAADSVLDVGGTMEASAEVVPEVEGDVTMEDAAALVVAPVIDKGKARARSPEEVLVLGSDGGMLLYPKDPKNADFWRKAAEDGHRVPVSAGDMFGDESALATVGGSDGLVGHWPCERCAKRGAACKSYDKAGATSCEACPSSSKERPSKICKVKVVAEGRIHAAVQAEDRGLLEAVKSTARSLASIAGSLVDHGLVLHRIADTLTEQQKTNTSLARSVYAMRKMLRREGGENLRRENGVRTEGGRMFGDKVGEGTKLVGVWGSEILDCFLELGEGSDMVRVCGVVVADKVGGVFEIMRGVPGLLFSGAFVPEPLDEV
ncbi:hypothetical protein BKA62DRAFT_673556 [Auriculariales sp. MPI-PUGE-AT-0066]|nr:hypothetical protein BKA62DRAFT_673556 [Auriculariales sp. MPI-PUGE-AT-0066]